MRKIKTVAAIAGIVMMGYFVGLNQMGDGHDHGELVNTAEARPTVKAPDFSLPDVTGGKVTLGSYRGKWVLVNFWARWCSPCVGEIPSLNKFAKKMKGQSLEVLGVNIENTTPEAVKKFASDKNMSFAVAVDADKKVSDEFGVSVLPMSFLIDPKGEVIGKITGARNWEDPDIIAKFMDYLKPKAGVGSSRT